MKCHIAAALLLAIFEGSAWGQAQTDISQKTGGECSPAVVSQGRVTITCIGLDTRQQELLRKMPGLIDQLLKRSQSDRNEILAKLEEILRIQRDTEARLADRVFSDDQRSKLAAVLAGNTKFPISFESPDGEPVRYARQIIPAFAGWAVDSRSLGITTLQLDPDVQASIQRSGLLGALIITFGPNSNRPNVLTLSHALDAAGVKIVRGQMTSQTTDEIAVYVPLKAP